MEESERMGGGRVVETPNSYGLYGCGEWKKVGYGCDGE